MAHDISMFGIAKWRFVPDEPRHNTWHQALFDSAQEKKFTLTYVGLKDELGEDWVHQVLPPSILKYFPYVDPRSFLKVVRLISSRKGERNVIYIFEGTIFWLFFLYCIKLLIPNCTIICNLFSSSHFDEKLFYSSKVKRRYRWLFEILKKLDTDQILVTFDTQLMATKATEISGYTFHKFPVPSSFAFNSNVGFRKIDHMRVLVNLRNFSISRLQLLIESSCKSCTFVFPRGSIGSKPLIYELGHYSNTMFDDKVIPVRDWKSYVDSFDYMIFLYDPESFAATNISGRVLDAIVRGVSVCVPLQMSECVEISEKWGKLKTFDITCQSSISESFNHPRFSVPRQTSEPPFSPQMSLMKLIDMTSKERRGDLPPRRLTVLLLLILISMHAFFSFIFSSIYQIGWSIQSKTSFLKKRMR